MDIRVTSTGKTFYQVDSGIAAVLVEAFPTVFEHANKPATSPPPAKARWFIGKSLFNETTILNVKCDACQRNECYTGRVEDIPQFEKSLCIHSGKCPESVREQYAGQYTGAPSLGNEFWQTARSKEPERPR